MSAVHLRVARPGRLGSVADLHSTAPAAARQTQLTAAAVLAHNAGIKVYLGIYLQNANWSTQITTNPAPLLGNWDPAFTDANGNEVGHDDHGRLME